MDNSLSSFILVAATLAIGLVLFGYASSYFAYQSAQAYAVKEASSIAASLNIKYLEATNSNGEDSVLILPYDSVSNSPIYISVFIISNEYYNYPLDSIVPTNSFIPVNGSSLPAPEIVTVYSPSNNIIYNGTLVLYPTYLNAIQSINIQKDEHVMIWILMNINGNLYRVGYLEVTGL